MGNSTPLATGFVSIAFVAATVMPAAAATYQKAQAFDCTLGTGGSSCVAAFPKIAAGKTLKVQFVSCTLGIVAIGEVKPGLSALGISPVFPGGVNTAIPKQFLTWQFTDAGHANAIASMAVPFDIPAGKSPEVHTFTVNANAVVGTCTITGKLVP